MEQKKPTTKIILNDLIYMTFTNQETSFWCQKSDSRYLWLGSCFQQSCKFCIQKISTERTKLRILDKI